MEHSLLTSAVEPGAGNLINIFADEAGEDRIYTFLEQRQGNRERQAADKPVKNKEMGEREREREKKKEKEREKKAVG